MRTALLPRSRANHLFERKRHDENVVLIRYRRLERNESSVGTGARRREVSDPTQYRERVTRTHRLQILDVHTGSANASAVEKSSAHYAAPYRDKGMRARCDEAVERRGFRRRGIDME